MHRIKYLNILDLMIYTGADLIRTSGQQFERAAKLELVDSPKAVDPASSHLNEDTQDALKRFARFVNDKKPKKPRPYTKPSAHPYNRMKTRTAYELDRGQMLDIFA